MFAKNDNGRCIAGFAPCARDPLHDCALRRLGPDAAVQSSGGAVARARRRGDVTRCSGIDDVNTLCPIMRRYDVNIKPEVHNISQHCQRMHYDRR